MEKTSKTRRAEMGEVMQNLDIKDMNDINELFKEMVPKNGLDGAKTGGRFIHSLRFSSLTDCRISIFLH